MKQINYNRLLAFCNMKKFPNVEYNAQYSKKGNYYFINNNSNLLAVFHWDTVSKSKNPEYKFLLDDNGVIIGLQSIQLDDRLGAYLILDYLPKMGLKYDILITTGEETGQSTAQNFLPEYPHKRKYNWCFSFDRNDIYPVLYEYGDDTKWLTAVESIMPIDYGTFSDICKLSSLGFCGVNWGAGYYNEHSNRCYTTTNSINIVTKNFINFYNRNKSIKYNYDYDYYKMITKKMYEPYINRLPITKSNLTCEYCGTSTKDTILDARLGAICEFCKNDLYNTVIKRDEDDKEPCFLCKIPTVIDDLIYENGKSYCNDCFPYKDMY